MVQFGNQFQANPSVGLRQRPCGKDALCVAVGFAANPARFRGQQGQLGIDARCDDFRPLAGAQLQMPAKHARLRLKLLHLGFCDAFGRGRFAAQFEEFRQFDGHRPAHDARAKAAPRQSIAQLRCKLLLVDFVPNFILGSRVVLGKSDEEHFEHHAVGRHLRRLKRRLDMAQRRAAAGQHQQRGKP